MTISLGRQSSQVFDGAYLRAGSTAKQAAVGNVGMSFVTNVYVTRTSGSISVANDAP